MVMQNAVPRLRIAITAKLQEMLGAPTHPETGARGADLDYYLAQDYERALANTPRADRPVIALHMRQAASFVDPTYQLQLPVLVQWDLRIRQGLIAQEAAGYTHHTANRLWDIADFVAGRIHRTQFLPGVEIGVTEVVSIVPFALETQERLDMMAITVNCRTRLLISSQRSLDSDQDFRTYFGTDDLGQITSTSLTVNTVIE